MLDRRSSAAFYSFLCLGKLHLFYCTIQQLLRYWIDQIKFSKDKLPCRRNKIAILHFQFIVSLLFVINSRESNHFGIMASPKNNEAHLARSIAFFAR
jgi:hypothetical protein